MKVLWVLGLILGLVVFLNAQTAVLSGTVRQVDNETIPKVKVSAFGTNNEKYETVSDGNGFYSIILPKGDYAIEFYAEGYKRTRVENYKIGLEEKLQLNLTLEVGMIIQDPAPEPSNYYHIFCGKVVDKIKGEIPNALIEAKRIKANKKSDNKTYKSFTDKNGNYRFEVPDGMYNITYKFKGFKKFVLKNQLLPIEPRGCIDIELEVDAKTWT